MRQPPIPAPPRATERFPVAVSPAAGGSAAWTDAWVGLGSNLGPSVHTLRAAFLALACLPQSRLVARSRLYRSAPVQTQGPDFVNAVGRLSTRLAAHDLLRHLQVLERRFGRERPFPGAPRTLDLDLLMLGQTRVCGGELTLPHPRMHERAFVLRPLGELDPGLEIPGRGPIRHHLAAVADQACSPLEP